MQLTDKKNKRVMDFPEGISNMLLTHNPTRWELSVKKPLPKVEKPKEIVKEVVNETKAKRGRKPNKK
jgi:hypothetical protein